MWSYEVGNFFCLRERDSVWRKVIFFIPVQMKHKRQRNETCSCGDVYCNQIVTFLGSVVSKRCSLTRVVPNTSEKTLKRRKLILSRVRRWRQTQNKRFPKNPIKETPSKSSRFNEIHYPILFLNAHKEKKRLPMEITVDLAKKTNIFSCDSVYVKTDTIFVIPTLTTHDAIQAGINCNNVTCYSWCFMIIILIKMIYVRVKLLTMMSV